MTEHLATHGAVAGPAERPPGVVVDPQVSTAAGSATVLRVVVTNHAAEPRAMAVSVLGLDPEWAPPPVRTPAVPPGQSQQVDLVLEPARGTLPARYPFTVAVQAVHPVTGRATSRTTLAESTLLLSGPGDLQLNVTPTAAVGVWGQRLTVLLRNVGSKPTTVTLEPQGTTSAPVRVPTKPLELRPGESRKVRGRIRVANPRTFGQRTQHSFTVTARSAGAPQHAQGIFTARPFFTPTVTKLVAFVAIVAVWATLAVVFIPRLVDTVGRQGEDRTVTEAEPGGGGAGGTGGSGSGDGAGGADGGADGGDGAGGADGEGAGAGAGQGVQLNGVVSSEDAGGVLVSVVPTSLVDEEASGAQPVGFTLSSSAGSGMVPATATLRDVPAAAAQTRTMVTREDGTWSFPDVAAPGYYLLTFSKPGFQTRQYVVDSSATESTDPLKVLLSPGEGRLDGEVLGPRGTVGGADVTITDGTNTITTSSNTGAGTGQWSVDGLSTPSTYLVTVAKDRMSTESRLVTLDAGGAATVRLRMRPGVGSLVGTVRAADAVGRAAGLGGARVTATNGTITRTASTVTSGPVGRFTLSDLPVPGDYTVTVSADGYQPQTSTVHFDAGETSRRLNASLTADAGVVAGTIAERGGPGLVAAGLTLTNEDHTYKTMTTSAPRGGFRFDGVAPGEYVLVTEKYGFVVDYVAVRARAGRTIEVNRRLAELVDGVLPASARIRGSVIDARTGGEVTCPQGRPRCLTVSVLANDVVGADDGGPKTYRTSIAPNEQYTLPPADAKAGLLPGLHVVRVSAPGYEPATAKVEVPADRLVTAPPVTLFPNPVITGQVTPVVGTPAGATCVVAVRGDVDGPPPGCEPPPCKNPVVVTDPAEPVCARVNPDSGVYRLRVPARGLYTVYVLPTDPEYVRPPAATFTLEPGGTQLYDRFLHRSGRIQVTVREPGDSGQLQAAKDVKVTLVEEARTGRTDDTGRVLLNQLPPGTHTVKATAGGVTASGEVTVAQNQTANLALALTEPVGPIVGNVMVTIAGEEDAVQGATVQLTGVTSYVGDTAIRQTVELTSDDDGCFAVYTAEERPADTETCPAITTAGGHAREFTLLSRLVDIRVESPDYDTLVLTNYELSAAGVNEFTVHPKPVTFTGGLSAQPGGPDLSAARIDVIPSASGTGTLHVRADSSGALTWRDSNYGENNLIRPGEYTMTATLPGHAPARVTFTCLPERPCVLPADMFTLQRLSKLTVRAEYQPATGDPVVVTGARFVLHDTGDNPGPEQSRTASPRSDSVTFDDLLPGESRYQVRVQAAGYQFATFPVGGQMQCDGVDVTGDAVPAVDPGATDTCTVQLERSGAIEGIVRASPEEGSASTSPLAGATVTARRCADSTSCDGTDLTGPEFSATTDGDGHYHVTGSTSEEGLKPGTWWVVTSALGYEDAADDVPILTPPTLESHDVTLYAEPVALDVTVRDANGKLLNGLTVRLLDGPSAPVSAEATGGAGRYRFEGVLPGTYTLQASGGKINTTTVAVIIEPGRSDQRYPMTVGLGANAVQGTVTGVQGADIADVHTPMAGATVCVVEAEADTCEEAVVGTSGESLSTSSGADGSFLFRAVPDGTYHLRAQKTGWLAKTSAAIVFDHRTASPPGVVLPMDRVTHAVKITVSAAADDLASTGAVTLTSTGEARPTLTADLTGPSDGSYTATFNQVPFGCWQAEVALPDDGRHFGELSFTDGDTGDCTTGFEVSVEPDAGEVAVEYALDGEPLTVTVAATTVDPDDEAIEETGLTITAGSTVLLDETVSIGADTVLWVPPGSYTATATPDAESHPATEWPPESVQILVGESGGTRTITLTQQAGTLVVKTTGATADDPQTVTIDDGEGTTGSEVTEGEPVTFEDLAPGHWDVTVAEGEAALGQPATIVGGTTTTVTFDEDPLPPEPEPEPDPEPDPDPPDPEPAAPAVTTR